VDGSVCSFSENGVPVDVVFVGEGSSPDGTESVEHYVSWLIICVI
jgi:hypothetical protein